jgi:hypothetical protein
MPEISINIFPNLFQITIDDLQKKRQAMLDEIDSNIKTSRLLGMSDEQIYNNLISDFENEIGIFQKFQGAIEGEMDTLVNQTTQVSKVIDNPIDQKCEWVLDPTVEKHCDTCLEREGQIKTFLEWNEEGIPGSDATECGGYCMCSLELVNE